MKMRYAILIVLLAVILILIYYFRAHKVTPQTPINIANQTGHFNSPNDQFSFDYPIFEKWNLIVKATEIDYVPSADSKINIYQPYKLIVQEKMLKVAPDFWAKQPKNPKGTSYYTENVKDNNGNGSITFRVNSSSIEVLIPKTSSQYGFDGQKIWDTVLNSFNVK